ncbi:MAG: histidinol dehydrogenase [Thermoprotei archaeon]
MRIFSLKKDDIAQTLKLVRSLNNVSNDIIETVSKIIEDVKINGNKALIKYTEKFDGIKLNPDEIKVTPEEINKAHNYVNDNELSAAKTLIENIKKIESKTIKRLNWSVALGDITIYQTTKPLESIGCYVPGGKASYPSTLIMTATPAIVANVPRIVVTSPPSKITPFFLAVSNMIGVSEIYRVGGAQAIAALAYGTETIKPVNKIIGPGNMYVTIAKLLVSKDVMIDMPAGPTELLIVADENADATEIALDLVAQAEHGTDSLCGLVTVSTELAKRVIKELSRIINSAERKEIVNRAIEEKSFIAIADDVTTLQEFVNELAPEHLEVLAKDAYKIIEGINNAGVIVIGTSSVITDYYTGVNHVLPTSGYAKLRSGLTILDYIKILRIVSVQNNLSPKIINVVRTFAQTEGLSNHFKSIEYRILKERGASNVSQNSTFS